MTIRPYVEVLVEDARVLQDLLQNEPSHGTPMSSACGRSTERRCKLSSE